MQKSAARSKPEKIDTEKAQSVVFQPNPGPQTDFLASSEQEVLYGGAAGGGKMAYEYQNLLTPNGWKNIKDLQVGDSIVGSDGKAQKVSHLFAWETQPVWEVELDDGTVFDTAKEHLWFYWIARSPKKVVTSTAEMKQAMEDSGKKAIIPTVSVEFNAKPTEVDPYTLGVLLGDGCMVNKSITFTCKDSDYEHFKTEVSFLEGDLRRDGFTVRVVGDSRKKFVEYLLSVGLIGAKSNSKFIPEEFLVNSKEVRLNLLRGLLDTDGYRDVGRARAEYTTVSGDLAEGVKFLAQSLGYRVSTYHKIGSYRDESGKKVLCQKVYRLYITGQDVDNLFKLERKKNGIIGKQVGRRVVEVRETERQARGRCITVSNEDGLYVTDDFIVTHNSFAMVADPIRYVNNPAANMLLVRRSTEELRELISVSKKLYPQAIPEARFLERDKTWVFPSGATLWMSYLDRDDDVTRYQGQAFSWIGFDELTQWSSPYAWNYMRSRLRTSKDSGLKLYQRATTNPGGSGHLWVKKTFIDPAPYNTSFWATDTETGEVIKWPKGHRNEGQPLFKRRFIPANLFDNPYLSEDGMYEANLLSLPEHQRRQLLEGDWSSNEGSAFPEFNSNIHVIEPFDIPANWPRFRAADYGYGSYTGVLWFTVAPSEQLIVYRELYVSKVTAVDLADMINEIESKAGERMRYGVLDSSLWHNRGDTGPSLAEQMILRGCRWRPSDRSRGSRVAGKNEIHRRLQVDEFTEEPRLVIFNNCRNLISQLPSLPTDKNNPEDVDTNSEDHLYDALRYGCMTRPRSNLFDFGGNDGRTGFQIADKNFGY